MTFTATDASGNTVQETVTLTVVDINRKPELAAVANQAVQENQQLGFTVAATDPDGDEFSLGVLDLPAGATFISATGVFGWTPTLAQSGNYEVIFTADDHKVGGLDSLRVIISVGNVNRPAVIDPVARQVLDEGKPLSLQINASDPDTEDEISISVSGLPGTPQITQEGTNPAAAVLT